MADGLYIGMAAANARAQQLDSIADNLANAETPGFKAARPAFQSFLAGAGVTDKVTSAAVATGIDMTPGTTVTTDNPLDITPDGSSFIAVRTANGTPAYTRNGSLTVSGDNRLVLQGMPVLGTDGEPITIPPETTATIQEDGTVIAEGRPVGQLALIELTGNVAKVGSSLFVPGPGGVATAAVDGKVRIGELEMSNATPLEAAVQMISAQRHFETAMQAISTYRRMDDKAMETGRVR